MYDDVIRLHRWGFAFPGPVRDSLTELALAGTKTATASLLVEYGLDGDPIPLVGERQVLVGSADQPVALVETTSIRIVRLADVDDAHAIDEGEGYANAAEFRATHEEFWNGYIDDLRERLADPGLVVDDDTEVVLERFRVVERLDVAPPADRPIRLATAADLPAASALLARAFRDDPMARWPMVSDENLLPRIRRQFEIADTPFVERGWMTIAGDMLGVMVLVPPGDRDLDDALLQASIAAMAEVMPDGGARYRRFWEWIGEHEPDEPHLLLDQLATEPCVQGRRVGTHLIAHAVTQAATLGLPLVLETARQRNVALYGRHGFRIVETGVAPDGGPQVWFLRRDPAGS